jgi:hypothetical protein
MVEKDARLNTPVLFLIFCRPETTKVVFESIRKARPARLYVAADGPRHDSPAEFQRCQEARKIATEVDWDCEVHTLFRDKNLGCGDGPSTAITWFFERETEGIILEDDCLPSSSFFPYCASLLERYRDDTRIMHIGGVNLEKPYLRRAQYSYSFSHLTNCWGWATWRRAWNHHDFDMGFYNEICRKGYLKGHYNSIYERDYFEYAFEKVHRDRRNIWDYQWQFACRINSGLVISPSNNLVINIGLGGEATNTIEPRGIGCDLKLEEINFPLNHPDFVMVNGKKERQIFRNNLTSQASRMKSTIKHLVPKSLLDKLKRSIKYILVVNKAKTIQEHGTIKY